MELASIYCSQCFIRELFQESSENIPICCWLTLGLIGLLCFIILFYFLICYMHCFSMVFSVVMYGALVSVSVLRRLRSCRHIIIIIIINRVLCDITTFHHPSYLQLVTRGPLKIYVNV